MRPEAMAPVVVGVDGSTESLHGVLELAAEEAAARVTPLLVVYAHRPIRGAVDPRGLSGEHDLLTVAVADALADHPGLAVSARLAVGEPAPLLLARSGEASLVVVGHRPGARGASVAAALIGGARCPVIVYRRPDPAREFASPRPVLVGVDGGAATMGALEFAFEEATLRGAPLRAMHVASGPAGSARTHARAVLDDALTGWSAKYPDVAVYRAARTGPDVAAALIRASRYAQLVVVGAGGRYRPVRHTGATLLDHAGCPVAVVPLDRP